MGCDIHLYVEKKVDGNWVAVKGKNPRIEMYREWAKRAIEREDLEYAKRMETQALKIENGSAEKEEEDDYDKAYDAPQVLEGWAYDGRNYDLFAILADVRNGRGFAGFYTGEGFNPISDAKGLPEDVSSEVKAESDRWDCDGHSHSYFNLKELVYYDWEQTTITLKDGIYNMDTPLEELKKMTEGVKYKDSAGSFYTKTMEKLHDLANGDLESVRIVFWFDN
jgi:hypothetical protein